MVSESVEVEAIHEPGLEPFIGRDVKQIINQMHWKMPGSRQTWGLHQDCRSRKPDRAFRNLADAYVQTGLAVDRQWRSSRSRFVA